MESDTEPPKKRVLEIRFKDPKSIISVVFTTLKLEDGWVIVYTPDGETSYYPRSSIDRMQVKDA